MHKKAFSPTMGTLPDVVKNLLIINVIFFIAKWLFATAHFDLDRYLALFYFDSPFFRPWQLVTYMFMHENLQHIFFNMFTLYMFGSVLENVWGPKRFLYYYFLCGLGAIALQMAIQAFEVHAITGSFVWDQRNFFGSPEETSKLLSIYQGSTLGASGAIFGLLIGFGMLFPNMELFIYFIPIPIKAKYLIAGFVILEVVQTIWQMPGDHVAHMAHLGGGLVGFFLLQIWGLWRFGRYN